MDIRLRGSSNGVWRAPLDPPPAENGHWPSLAAALSDLARAIGVTQGTLAISLLPPFAEVRRLELPPLRDDEMHRVLARGAARYFVGASGPQVVGASVAGRRARGAPTPVVAAAASARLLGAIHAAAQPSGWTVAVTAPAETAWTAAAVAMWPSFSKRMAFALVAHDDRTDLLQIDNGRLVNVRRFRAGAADAALIAEAVGTGAAVGVLGLAAQRRELAAALASKGVTATMPAGERAADADDPNALAARFVGEELGPVLRGDDAIAADRARLARVTRWMAVAAAALFVASAFIELWGVKRQLRLVREERARIRPEIASTMVGRTTVDAAYRHLTTLATIERNAPHWSTVLGTLTDAIPENAFLLAVRTRDDSVIVDGLAERARRVFDGLENANILRNVRAAAPVRRELQNDGTEALEHFVIAAVVAKPDSTRGPIPASNPARRSRP